MLFDPFAAAIGPELVQPAAAALQRHLFGVGDGGKLSLILIDGPKDELTRLALLSAPELRLLLDGQFGDLHSWSRRHLPDDSRKAERLRKSAADPGDETAPPPILPVFRGVFVAPKQEFIGCVASRWRPEDPRYFRFLMGRPISAAADAGCVDEETARAVLEALPGGAVAPGILYLPVLHQSHQIRAARRLRARCCAALATGPGRNVAALLYDVPRDPFYSTIGDVTAFLGGALRRAWISGDATGLQCSALSHSKVLSIAISLPNSEDSLRQSVLRRFAGQRDALRARQILSMVMNVRSAAEIVQCVNSEDPLGQRQSGDRALCQTARGLPVHAGWPAPDRGALRAAALPPPAPGSFLPRVRTGLLPIRKYAAICPPRLSAERCRSGRTGRSRKPKYGQLYRGFESHPLRQRRTCFILHPTTPSPSPADQSLPHLC